MNSPKYYKLSKCYYKQINAKQCERIHGYRHHYGIDIEMCFLFSFDEMEEITEAQYNRVKKVVLAKLLNQ